MKKLSLLVILILICSLTACSALTARMQTDDATEATNSGSATVAPDDASESAKADFDAAKVSSKITVSGETYKSYFSNYLFLILGNTSGVDCDLSVSVDFYDSSDKIVGTQSESIDAFAAGTTLAASFYCDDEFTRYEYTIAAKELSYYHCVDQDLVCEVSTASNKAIISITNNGKMAAQFVEYRALFYKDGKLIGDDWGYIVDDDSEIKVGATQKKEATCYEDFDNVIVYFHGRSEADFTM